jgi:hypothetical protein
MTSVVSSAGGGTVDIARTGTLQGDTEGQGGRAGAVKVEGKGKVKVNDRLFDEAWNEELAKLKAKKAAIQAMID